MEEPFDERDLSSLPSFKSNTKTKYSSGSSSSESNIVPPPPPVYDDSSSGDELSSSSSGRVFIDGQKAASEEDKGNRLIVSNNSSESSPTHEVNINGEDDRCTFESQSSASHGAIIPDNTVVYSYESSNDNEFIDDLFDLIPMDVTQPNLSRVPGDMSVDSYTGYQRDTIISIRSSIEDESQQSPEAFSSAYHDNLRDPPTDSSSCDSEDIEADCRLSHDKLLSLVEVGRVFALRCAFDHWSRVAMYKRSLLMLERHSIALKKMECVSNHVTMRWALSTIRFRILEKKSKCKAANILSNICLRALLSVTFQSWLGKTAQYNAVNNYMKEARMKLMKHCLSMWKVFTTGVITRREKCFLMMLFNRWRLYAEEMIDERQQDTKALMHWAKHLMAKAFRGLRGISKETKMSSYSFSSFSSPLTGRISNTSRKTWTGSSYRPTSIYRSPQRSTLSCRTPDPMSRFTSIQSRLHLGSLGKPAMGYGSTSSYQDPRQSKNGSYRASTTFNHLSDDFNGQSIVGDALSPQWLSKIRRSIPRSSFSRNFTEKTNNTTNPPLNFHYSMPNPSVSVRENEALFKDKDEIANVLDTMVSIVEQSSAPKNGVGYYQPTIYEYAGYAGCNEELYNRL